MAVAVCAGIELSDIERITCGRVTMQSRHDVAELRERDWLMVKGDTPLKAAADEDEQVGAQSDEDE